RCLKATAGGLSASWGKPLQNRRLNGKIEIFSRRLWGRG
ncbi:hypothetical protein QMW92_17610, partial [Cronobacter sakazakii]|nr:hypothetical protein [Cronobacter sakazakii]